MFFFCLFLTLCFIPFNTADAETIHLKSGQSFNAEILEYTNQSIRVQRGNVPLTYFKDEIESIAPEKITPLNKKPKSSFTQSHSNNPASLQNLMKSVVIIKGTTPDHNVLGTGFFISSDGLIATNFHVIFGVESLAITTHDGQSFPVDFIVNFNEDLDLCIIKVNVDPAPAVALGDSDQIKSSENLLTIGHRGGSLYQISGGPFIKKIFLDDEENLQTKMLTGHGNSGGPLFNNEGKVVGISKSFNPEFDYNFAIPINLAKPFLTYKNPETPETFQNNIRPAQKIIYKAKGHLLAGQFSKALDEFNQALQIEPQNLFAMEGRAKCFQNIRIPAEEFKTWQEILTLAPNHLKAHRRLGILYLDLNNPAKAIEHLEKAAQFSPKGNGTFQHLGFAYGQKKELTKAIEAYKKAITLDPSDGSNYYNIAIAYFNKKDFQRASEYTQKAQDAGYKVDDSFLSKLNSVRKFNNFFETK